jgi:peptide/nickel transport system ATP-binding protein
MKPLLDIRNLNVVYETRTETVEAVNNISFTVNKGETLGIVGETGAGKTTTALSILRLLPERTGVIKSGSILFDDEDLLMLSEEKMRGVRGARISMIFQDPMTSLNPVLTVDYQIKEALFLHNPDLKNSQEINKKVDDILQLVGIEPSRKNSYPHEFSGGMKQRVVIAIALACSPELLIADEPTTALDVTIQAQVLVLMEKLKQELGMAMIMITHDLGVVAQTCEKIAVMYAGEIIEYASFEDFFGNDTHHPYTEGLFGSIPNIHDESTRLSPIPGLMPDAANLPSGCKFHPRCKHCMEICKTTSPKSLIVQNKTILCHLFDKEVMRNG